MTDSSGTSPKDRILRHQFEELQQRASVDALSGLLNRATMEQHIQKRLDSMNSGENCALMIVDLDDFKQVNDTLGHQAGDQAIRKSAQILSKLFRAGDIVGRLGGDEFAVFLSGPQVTEDLVRKKGAEICETLQLALGDHTIVNLTVSVGIYLASGCTQHFDGMYQSADLALYKAKKSGKHGFCLKCREDYKEEHGDDFRPVNTIPLNGLLEYMDCGVALLEMGEQPQVIYVSPSFCRIIGAESQSYVLPQPLHTLIHPDDRLSLMELLREGLQQQVAVEHTHRVLADDKTSWRWWHVRAVQIAYDNPNPVMLVTTTDISQFKEKEHRLEEENKKLQAAFDQTMRQLWEVDIQSKTFSAFDWQGKPLISNYTCAEFPECLITGGWIHSNSVYRFREFAQELLNGRTQGYGNFILRYRDSGCYGWATLSYRMLYDDVGRAVKAIGLIEDLSKQFAGQKLKNSWFYPLPEGLVSDLAVGLRASLTQDRIEELWIEGKSLSLQLGERSCSQILRQEWEKVFCKEDQKLFFKYFDREQLLRLFSEGRRWAAVEYRRADGGGDVRWVRHVIHLEEEPLTKEVFLSLFLVGTDHCHQREKTLGGVIERDPVSGLYDRKTVLRIADLLLNSQESDSCALALLQADGMLKIYENDSTMLKRSCCYIAIALSVALGGRCFLGQYSADQILIVFPTVGSKENLRCRIEESVAFVRMMLRNTLSVDSMRFVTGVAVQSAHRADSRILLEQVSRICDLGWNSGADTVTFAHEDHDWNWTELRPDEKKDQITVHPEGMERPLSETEKDVAFRCLSSMLRADSLERSIQGVLNDIGIYYSADRIYILMLSENRYTVTMPYEWTASGKCSIQQSVSGMRTSRFPLLERCMQEHAPIFLRRTLPATALEYISSERFWHYSVFPLDRNDRTVGFLCVENSRVNSADAALLSVLIPYMLREGDRFHDERETVHAVRQLTELPNLRSYMETIYTLTSEQYSSLGAVCLDIPGMGAINGNLGFEYGSKLLWYVSKTLTDLFGPSLLFRTWETEFMAFCPNTTRQVFLGKCNRLQSILQRRYPKEIRIGYTWAEENFNGNRLANEARSIMRSEQTEFGLKTDTFVLGKDKYSNVREAAAAGRFTVYFQPKMRLKNETLVGAEALVRGVGEDGNIISPVEFIGTLEENGSIRELDLYVLERVLSQMEKWRASGKGVIPVSVNLSRVTLLHPSTLASILAIQSRYPQIPLQALELEITESAGSIEFSELKEIVSRFRTCGLRFSLDDFGSQYANLSLFTNVDFAAVKLDRSLIIEMGNNPINEMLVHDIVQICKTCNMVCVAEGVETREQIQALKEAGCDYAQGYYFDRPLSTEAFEQKYLCERAAPFGESDIRRNRNE